MPVYDILNSVYNHYPVTGLFAIVVLLVGFALNFFGIRLFRFVIAVTGFILFALTGYIILINIHLHNYKFGNNFDKVIGIGMLSFGVLGALLSGFLWRWILLGLGALGGISLGLGLFSSFSSMLPKTLIWLRPLVLGIFAIIGAFLLKLFERPLIIFATSISGALLFCFGLDAFVATGFDLIILAILSGSMDTSKIIDIKQKQMYGMISLWIGLTIVGIFVQSNLVGRNIKSHIHK